MSGDEPAKYMQEQFGKNLSYMRSSVLHMTQAELAERVHVSQHTISYFETNSRPNPKIENLINLSKVLNVAIDDLLTHDLEKLHRSTPYYPTSNNAEFSYFEGKIFYLYFIPKEGDAEIVKGQLKFDDVYNQALLRLCGTIELDHKYECALSFDEQKNIHIVGQGIGADKGRRMSVVMFFPEFQAGATNHYGGLGILVHLDLTRAHTAQRIALSDQKINLRNDTNKQLLSKFLTGNNEPDRVRVDRTCDSEFVEWLKKL